MNEENEGFSKTLMEKRVLPGLFRKANRQLPAHLRQRPVHDHGYKAPILREKGESVKSWEGNLSKHGFRASLLLLKIRERF